MDSKELQGCFERKLNPRYRKAGPLSLAPFFPPMPGRLIVGQRPLKARMLVHCSSRSEQFYLGKPSCKAWEAPFQPRQPLSFTISDLRLTNPAPIGIAAR